MLKSPSKWMPRKGQLQRSTSTRMHLANKYCKNEEQPNYSSASQGDFVI
uniref:Uncharacterized protein n=1 Tax=Arundo donax TaxID=35708 RepID=A0A0A9AMY3_ARUDO